LKHHTRKQYEENASENKIARKIRWMPRKKSNNLTPVDALETSRGGPAFFLDRSSAMKVCLAPANATARFAAIRFQLTHEKTARKNPWEAPNREPPKHKKTDNRKTKG
jgi:hypothetical protein